MKTLFTLLFLGFLSPIFSQEDAGSFYLHFLHPNFSNPSIQLSDSLITVNSNLIWKDEPRGYSSIYGGGQIPNRNLKSNLGFNLFTSDDGTHYLREAGLNYNWVILSAEKIRIMTGGEIGVRSQRYFRPRSASTTTFPQEIDKKWNSTLLNGGISIIWKSFMVGFSCRNCVSTGVDLEDINSDDLTHRKLYLSGSFKREINEQWLLRVDAVARNFNYYQLADITVSSVFFNKFHLGGSWRDEFPVNWAVHGGFKCKNYFFYGVFQPKNRRHGSAIELAAQLEFHHLKK
ncbi:MAG: type IX secretion system membrane protein PorP/SprF [Bacteroidota bacterium]